MVLESPFRYADYHIVHLWNHETKAMHYRRLSGENVAGWHSLLGIAVSEPFICEIWKSVRVLRKTCNCDSNKMNWNVDVALSHTVP